MAPSIIERLDTALVEDFGRWSVSFVIVRYLPMPGFFEVGDEALV